MEVGFDEGYEDVHSGKTIKTSNMEHPLRLDGHTNLGIKGSSPRALQRH
jgi:hypothetical protein